MRTNTRIRTMCSETKELGHDMLWQGATESHEQKWLHLLAMHLASVLNQKKVR